MVGVPFRTGSALARQYPSARLAVEIAYGADLGASPSSWLYTDVTEDVRQSGVVTIQIGKPSETDECPPATCKFTLNSPGRRHTPMTPLSPNWPNVRQGTPVRVRVALDGATWITRFAGRSVGFKPSWKNPQKPTCAVTAAGYLRHMSPIELSPMAVSDTSTANGKPYPAEGWTLEESGAATAGLSVVGRSPLTSIGSYRPSWGKDNAAVGSQPVLSLGTGMALQAPASVSGNFQRVQFLLHHPKYLSKAGVTDFVLLRVITTGTVARWDVILNSHAGAGTNADVFMIRGYDLSGNQLFNGGGLIGAADIPQWISFEREVSGSNINWALAYTPWGVDAFTLATQLFIYPTRGTATSASMGQITQIVIAPNQDIDGVGIGHLLAYGGATLADVPSGFGPTAIIGRAGETISARVADLAVDRSVPITLPATIGTLAGPEPIGTALDVLRDVERTERGLLYDGLSDGLVLLGRAARYNRSMTFELPAEMVKHGLLEPDDTERATTNRVKASRPQGSDAIAQALTGPLGVNTIGPLESSIKVNPALESALLGYAQWGVYLGTREALTFPTVGFNVLADPSLAPGWLAVTPWLRMDITGLGAVLDGAPFNTYPAIIEGWIETISSSEWSVSVHCSPEAPYEVITRDSSGARGRRQAVDSTLSVGFDSDAMSFTVSSGKLWTTSAGAFPMDIMVNGEQITISSITGATSPQTFNASARYVNGVRKGHLAGESVTIYGIGVRPL